MDFEGLTLDEHRVVGLRAGTPIIFGGNRVTEVPPAIAEAFVAGDRLVVVQTTGDLLHIPAAEQALADRTVASAHTAFGRLGAVSDIQISDFYHSFAENLANDATFAPISTANEHDVAMARAAGRSTTRLELTASMRVGMVDGLRGWRDTEPLRDRVLERVDHSGWSVEQRRAGLGVVGFVFEGRPNVFADAAGVVRSGNTVVFRIGSDALGTARAIVAHALQPALMAAGLPEGCVSLLDSPSRAAGWALFSNPVLALAVARGSGRAVDQLGAVARQAGVPVSLHGTGGGWLVAGEQADADRFADAVTHSLDRKVCNTLNVCCIPRNRADELVPVFLAACDVAGDRRSTVTKLHVHPSARAWVTNERFDRQVIIQRAEGPVTEPQAETLPPGQLGHEWEWEGSPEVSLVVVDGVDDALALFNTQSPRLVISVISQDEGELQHAYERVDAPFFGNGFTRWVDGQFALLRPELGLSNWENGRLFSRSGVLSGDSVFTVRTRMTQSVTGLHR